jgi:hypothetical protein
VKKSALSSNNNTNKTKEEEVIKEEVIITTDTRRKTTHRLIAAAIPFKASININKNTTPLKAPEQQEEKSIATIQVHQRPIDRGHYKST